MSRSNRRAKDECDRVIESISRLRRALPELDRRNKHVAGGDGYPTTSIGSSGQRGAVSLPTERAALAPKERDPVRVWTRDALRALGKAAVLAAEIDMLLALALGGESPPSERCTSCARVDASRLVEGRCDACRMRSRRGSPTIPTNSHGSNGSSLR